MDEQKRLGLELALEDRLSDDLGQLTVRPYADYKRAALQRGARSSRARRLFSVVGIGATVAIALLLAIGAASALLNRSSDPASSPTATPVSSTSWGDGLIADVRRVQPQLAFVPLIPSFMPLDQPARVGTRTDCGSATTPCLEYSSPGLILVLQGPAGCCLDSARPDAVKDVEIRPGVNAQFIPVQAQFGGPILWWVEKTPRGDVYVSVSSPVYGREELIRVARSMVALPTP